MMMETFEIQTQQRNQFVEVTDRVRQVVQRSGIRQGICVAYCPHTTAAVTINENADPDVVHDMQAWLYRTIPQRPSEMGFPDFQHGEGNSDAHIKSSLFGSSVTVLVEKGDLMLGHWQGIYFCEFDGPRTRRMHVQCLGK
jgi:secondary thiamine-phosphate synthase enzyme